MQKITLIIIDQVRSNIQITNQFAPRNEKSVGSFNNFKAATNVNSLLHSVSQWIYLSKRQNLYPNDGLGLDGWVLELSTEKNKLAPSHYSIDTVFDKKYGIIPILSEYYFMENMSTWEKKVTKAKPDKLIYPLCVGISAHSKIITVYDPNDPKKIIAQTEKFTEKTFLTKYNTDARFKAIFELALKYSIEQRILKGYFREVVKIKPVIAAEVVEVVTEIESNTSSDQQFIEPEQVLSPEQDFDTETGEIFEPEPEEDTMLEDTPISNQEESEYTGFYTEPDSVPPM